MRKNILRLMLVLPWLFCVVANADSETLSSSRRPPIEIRPELYLGWPKDQPPPQPCRLPWPLVITMSASDTNNMVVIEPVIVTAYEEYVGASLSLRGLRPAPPASDPAAKTNFFDAITGAVIVLQELDFAANIKQHGANSLRIRCYTRIHMKENVEMRSYQTITTVECRPGRETLLAAFPGVTLRITAAWNRESPYLLSK